MAKEERKEYNKRYSQANAERIKEQWKQYYSKHREKILTQRTEYNKEYSKTQMGRAQRQLQQYKFMDRRNGLDEVIDFDAKWIVDNIYTKHCVHCGETDWHKLGCNRLDNSKPHTIDNVEPCCFHCNCRLNGKEATSRIKEVAKSRKHKTYQYDLDGKLLAIYESTSEAERMTNVKSGNISRCCLGKRPTAGGFKWTYEE